MDEGKGWLRTHWRTAVVLVLIFGLALFIRVYFVYGLAINSAAQDCTQIYTPHYSGGSDSYYWDRALCYSFQSGRDLGTDPMLNYPLSNPNPRPPLFPWFSLLVGRVFAPLAGDAWQAVYYTFLLSTGFFGALTVFPTYALGKEAFGRKPGLIGALLLAISVGHLQRSASTDADHDAFTLFFVVSTFYFFLRGLKTLNRRRWVESWFRKDAIAAGLRAFFRENRTSVLYALLAGLCVSVIALAWQGWAYVIVILLVWFGVELFLDRFRNEDTMGTWLLFAIALATPLLLAFQWYLVRSQVRVWFDVPAYLFFAALVLGLAFTVTRDYPWTLVVPATLIAAAAALAVGVVVNPSLANAFFTGAGYFIQSKVVTTIAEDQSPGMSQMILSFGLATFGLSLVAIAYMIWQVPRRRDPAFSLVVIWAFTAIFMAITAARFIFNASPAFAISAGFAVDQILVRADFKTMRRTYRSLAEGSWRNALRKSVKVRHVLAIIGIVFLVLLPNVWWAVDASIPFELKAQYDRQVAALLPTFLQAPGYSPSSQNPFYFGAFGYNIPRATDYYPSAWSWFATQDVNTPPELRPAFLSWWDYGFEAVDRGVHPTVADNFQNGVAIAGQFLTAQNETAGIALLSVRLLESDFRHNRPNFSPAVAAIFQSTGLPQDAFRSAFTRPQDYIAVVLSDTVTYGAWDANMQPLNAEYIYLTHIVTRHLDEEGVASLYHSIRAATGYDIGYFAVDSRLFPISVQNTGIFYAPVKLSDHRVLQLPDGRVLPFEFFQLLANTTAGSNIPIQFVRPGDTIQSEVIQYQKAFYDSMFYRAYIGYSPADLGSTDTGIPGFSQALAAAPPMPAWNLTHWRVVYRTAYYNPFTDVANHTSAWQAMNYDRAQQMQAAITAGTIKGVVDMSTLTSVANGVVFLRYYDGAWVNGTLWAGSTPLPNVRITVTDELGTPHYVTTTDAQGHYSALVPFGNVTITASTGTLNRRTLIGARTLASVTVPVTVAQAMRTPADADGDGVPDWIMSRDLHAVSHTAQGTVFFDLSRNSAFGAGDLAAAGATITLTNKEFAYGRTATSAAGGGYSIDGLPQGSYAVKIAAGGRTLAAIDVTIGATDAAQNIAVPFSIIHGVTTASSGGPVPAANIAFRDETNQSVVMATSGPDGSYGVGPLLPGNYTVTASSGDLAAATARIRPFGTDLWMNLTLTPSGTVAGTTSLFGTARPFASIEFQSASDLGMVLSVTADGSAHYSIRLRAGEWFVSGRFYDASGLYATLGRVIVNAGATSSYDAMFLPGARVDGTVQDPNPSIGNPQATVAFVGATGQLWLRTDAKGAYLAFLPSGSYDLQAFNAAGAYFATVSVSASTRMNIGLLGTSESVDWIVYRDLNGNARVDGGEGIPGAHITLTDDHGADVVGTTNATGGFRIPLFANRTYAGTVDAAGYETVPVASSSPGELRTTQPINLPPIPVSVQGSVLLNGSAVVNHPITVRAIPLGNGAVAADALTDSNGGYGLSLAPGTYALVVDENVSSSQDWRYQNLATDGIVLTVGEAGASHDINIVARTRVLGNVTLNGSAVAASVSFDGPERRTVNATKGGFEVYLLPGTYDAMGNRTVSEKAYVFMTTATVPAGTNLSFVLGNATQVSGRALYNGVAVPGPMLVSFVRLEGGAVSATTDLLGTYTATLAPGNYSVSLTGLSNATEGGVFRFYRYAFLGNITVAPGDTLLPFDLLPSRSLDNTTVSGTATLAGFGVDASVTFTARSGGAITASASADASGAYAVSLAPGTYDVYATRAFGTGAFLARITVPHVASFGRDLPLGDSFIVSGVTSDPLAGRTSANVVIQSTAELDLTSDASGGYAAVLPAGTYTITATKTGTENGIAVTYRATASLVLSADTILNLPMAKVVTRSAILTWDPSQRREIAAGETVTYTLVVRNTGNVADTFTLTGHPADWQFSFAPGLVPLNFGTAGNGSLVQVVIQTPANALVDHGTVSIVATSAADGTNVGSVDVFVDIRRVRAVSVSLDPSAPVFDGRFLNYTLLVKNSGNAKETVSVAVTNPDDLTAIGWSVKLAPVDVNPTGSIVTDLAIDANQSVRVRLQAASSGGTSGTTVVILVSAKDSMAVSATGVFPLQLPALASGGVTVTGPEVSHAAPLNLQLLAVAAGAVAAIGTGLVLTRRRR